MKRHGGNLNVYKWKKPIWIGYILYDSNYMIFWKRSNYGGSKKKKNPISGGQRLQQREEWMGGAEDF